MAIEGLDSRKPIQIHQHSFPKLIFPNPPPSGGKNSQLAVGPNTNQDLRMRTDGSLKQRQGTIAHLVCFLKSRVNKPPNSTIIL